MLLKLVLTAQRFLSSSIGRLVMWVIVVVLALVALQSIATLALRLLSSEPLGFHHAVMLAIGFFAARTAHLFYSSFLRKTGVAPGRE